MFCGKCGSEVPEGAQFCAKCGQSLDGFSTGFPAATPAQPAAPPAKISNHLVEAILVTLFCCLPLGIVAIVFAAQVNGKLAAGDIAGATEASKKAKMFSWIAAGVGLAGVIIYVLMMLVAGIGGMHN